MNSKNPEALALAFRKTKQKKKRIQELSITPKIGVRAKNTIVKNLCIAKAIEANDGTPWQDYAKGQEWYINSLVSFSALSSAKQLELEYEDVFGDIASEDQMVAMLEDM